MQKHTANRSIYLTLSFSLSLSRSVITSGYSVLPISDATLFNALKKKKNGNNKQRSCDSNRVCVTNFSLSFVDFTLDVNSCAVIVNLQFIYKNV